ncbi:hypothetical protein [Erythrobacter sp. THAF29]|uniref:hypothetical protein n=1 Tax=Erythrobacter sp. THAF29 TaxID=2587851 RepID=UPI0012696D36|nr:hypothetical protein [Erythrobacter sp. THAF29]QFT77307.1 hypothetical protein FIU90_07105 [Erythrobacter sp. THAF29]
MPASTRPLFLALLVLAILVRGAVGAPCCVTFDDTAQAGASSHMAHAGPADRHDGHAEDNTANPCCSACGPTLPPEIASLAHVSAPRTVPEPAPIRALATRPPYPAYEARGPPLLI